MAPRTHSFLLAFFLALQSLTFLRAEPIAYVWNAYSSGVLAGASFTFTEADVVVYADTADVKPILTGGWEVTGTTVAYISGKGYFLYSQNRRLSVTPTALVLDGIFAINSSAYENYDLQHDAPRRASSGANTISFNTILPTSGGDLSLKHSTFIFFESHLGNHVAPNITGNVQEIAAPQNAPLTLDFQVQAAAPFQLQWRRNDLPISGATSKPLIISALSDLAVGEYDVLITNYFGVTQSVIAHVSMIDSKPLILSNPISQGANISSNVTLKATVAGTPPFTWQWYFENTPLTNGLSSNLTLTAITPQMLGGYWAIVSNALGTATTKVARLDRSYIVAWGSSPDHIPAESSNIVSITGGDSHFVALHSNGLVDAWGDDATRGQNILPTNLTDVVSVSAGSTHTLTISRDGTTRLFGSFFNTLGKEIDSRASNDVAMVAQGVGAQHALALERDGSVVDWGAGDGTLAVTRNIPPGVSNIVSVAVAPYWSLALRADGRLFAWGANGYPTNIPNNVTGIVAIACGWGHNSALRADGQVISWGSLSGTMSGSNYVDLAAGSSYTVALRRTGQVLVQGGPNVPAAATNRVVGVGSGSGTAFALLGAGGPAFDTVAMDRRVDPGQNAYFRMRAIGAPPIAYQWNLNGQPIDRETNSWLVVTNVQPSQAGVYTVTASNSAGQVTSPPMGLNLLPVRILQISKTDRQLQITIESNPGLTYRLRSSPDLSAQSWTTSSELPATDTQLTFSTTLTEASAQNFYRVQRP